MFSPQFAEFPSSVEAFTAKGTPPAPPPPPPAGETGGERGEKKAAPAAEREGEEGGGEEPFATESAEVTLGAISGADTNDRSVALRLETLLDGQSTASGFEGEAMEAALEDWMRITHHVMDYQYVHDMNSYVKAVQEDERTRLDRQFNTITNDVMIKKHMYMMRQRDSDKLRSRVRLLMHTMLFVSAFAFLYASRAFFGAFGWIVMGVISFAFGIYVIMFIKINSTRRYDDWGKHYWNDGRDVEAEGGAEDLSDNAKCEQSGGIPFTT